MEKADKLIRAGDLFKAVCNDTSIRGSAFAAIRRHIDAAPAVAQWIPVSKRLPNKEEYTAKAEDGTEYYVRLLIAYKTDVVECEIGYYDGYKWMTEMPIRLIKDVVAWMPFPNLPQPPKEGEYAIT